MESRIVRKKFQLRSFLNQQGRAAFVFCGVCISTTGSQPGSTLYTSLYRAPVGQGPSGPDWLGTALGFWSGRALATGTAWACLCSIRHHFMSPLGPVCQHSSHHHSSPLAQSQGSSGVLCVKKRNDAGAASSLSDLLGGARPRRQHQTPKCNPKANSGESYPQFEPNS